VPYYPHLLAKQLERDICPVLSHLSSMGCSQQDIRLLVGGVVAVYRVFCYAL
jgi:hypothetical protein